MEFKLRSLRELSAKTRETVNRFPLITVFACAGAANHLYMDMYGADAFKYISRNIFMSLLILLPVLYSVRLLRESGWIGKKAEMIAGGVAVITAFAYLYYLPDHPLILFYSSQFAVFFVSSLCLCFVCLKQGAADDDYFWHFHALLFTRLVITGIYVLTIIIGTFAALGAIDALFNTELIKHNDVRIFIVTFWIFAPLFFLSGVPVPTDREYVMGYNPRWIKNIGIYVMVPLTTVYLGILYAYCGKILLQRQLPEGKVSYLVLSFAAFGILSLLVIYPFQKDENSKWCYWFSRYFYYLQIPLLVLLFIAIFTRVFEYGVTFQRYYLLALAVWLSFLSAFMIVRKNRSLIVIPLSMLLILAISTLGPWSSFNVSSMSQKGRLMKLLGANDMIRNGRIVPAKRILPVKVKADISSIVSYLHNYGELYALAYLTSSENTATPELFVESLGFKYVDSYRSDRGHFYYSYDQETFALPVGEYQSYVRFRVNAYLNKDKPSRVEEGGLAVEYLPDTATFRFIDGGSRRSEIRLEKVVEHFKATELQKTANRCEYLYKDGSFQILCLFNHLSGSEDGDGTHIENFDVSFLIRRIQARPGEKDRIGHPEFP